MKVWLLVTAILHEILVGCEGSQWSEWSSCVNGFQTRQQERRCSAQHVCTKDLNIGCTQYVENGFCAVTHRYSQWMKINCCASCKKGKTQVSKTSAKGGPLNKAQIKACLASVNAYRARHKNTGSLKWNAELARKAQDYAQTLLNNALGNGGVILRHDPDNGKDPQNGENLYYQDNVKVGTCADADKNWYAEIKDYSYATTDTINGKQIGHFTQMVWRETTEVGVGIAVAKSPRYGQYGNKITIVVAKYIPRGNINYYGKRIRDYSNNIYPLRRRQ